MKAIVSTRASAAAAAWPAVIAGGLATALYLRTLAPGLTWAHDGADGGDLLAAALTAGVPHPPGYPLYELLLRLALTLRPGSDPARTANLCSALAAALAVALLADLVRRSLAPRPARSVIALIVALAWAVSPSLWSQAVITEVYALNALAVVTITWLLWRWREAAGAARAGRDARQQRRRAGASLALAGTAIGLGLGHHLTLALLLPAAALWLWSGRRLLAVTPRWALPAAGFGLLAGLSVYLYLPWAAGGHPPVDWGAPRSAGGFAWLVTAVPYRAPVFGLPSGRAWGRLIALAVEALRQFWPWGAVLAGFGLWQLDRRDHSWWRFTGLAALAFSVYALGYNSADSYVYLIPAWAMVALWLAEGLSGVLDLVERALERGSRPWFVGDFPGRDRFRRSAAFLVLLPAALLLPIASAGANFAAMDLSRDAEASGFVSDALAGAGPRGIILVATDRPTFALWYAIYGLRQRTDLVPLNVNLYAFPWYRQTLAEQHPALREHPAWRAQPALSVSGEEDLPELPVLLDRLAAGGLLYRAEVLPIDISGFRERPAGALVQLLPR